MSDSICFGKTVDKFRFRQKNYKKNLRNYNYNHPSMPRHLYEHYSSVRHCGFLELVSITLIDKTDPLDPFRGEDYWRRTLYTMAPYDLNTEDGV